MARTREGYNFAQAKKAAFLAVFRDVGNITTACEAADIPRRLYYSWTEHDATFALHVEQCKVEAVERLEAEARRRAVAGVQIERRTYDHGELVKTETETRHSDTLLIFLLKGLAPEKYRDRVDVTQTQVVKTIAADAWDAV